MSDVAEKELISSGESSEESSSSEEEDEIGKEWTEEIEKTFLKTLSSLKSKDPKIYDAEVRFFDENAVIVTGQKSSLKQKKDQPMYLRDYERKIITEKGAVLSDEEDEDQLKRYKNNSLTYVEEQKKLKENFKQFLSCDDHGSSDEEHTCAGFLKIKTKTTKEKNREEEEYVEWLKGQKSELTDKEVENQLQPLRNYWADPMLDEGEQFLRDYVLNKRYLASTEELNVDELSFSEEERVLEECEEYEHQYNFRFEEPDKEFIKTYPRNIENSLRRKDEKRKRKREEKKKRREELLQQKQLEVKRLKKQKKAEMLERIKKLKEITGNPQVGFNDNDLEGDFSPNEYDRKMNELFNEEFYAGEDENEKPLFSDSSSIYEDFIEDDNFQEEKMKFEEATNEIVDKTFPVEDNDFIMDCDYDPRQARETKLKKQTRSARRKGHKKTKFAEVISKKKPVFNPNDKNFQQYIDEYYGLDFEDVIGDMPCRFKYRKVTPNSFGLSIEEILAADDTDLNKWCSMRKIDTIRPEQSEKFDLKAYSKRANDLRLKRKYLPSLFVDENNETEHENCVKASQSVPTATKHKRKAENNGNASHDSISFTEKHKHKFKNSEFESSRFDGKRKRSRYNADDSFSCKGEFKKRKLRKHFKGPFEHPSAENRNETDISDERLKAYGINPKKYKNKMKYGQNKR